ncbi:hypothetical protein Cgig2_028606 [Carnegiea gigantea]|uniref:Uncharacterized protein n=1 Tax=Carnegiea gigantea TaxID=171969 RepID=A0A9Q1QCY7_9CARY|nr:hypothetical protein Cgig2_028606 [Carnegiea gigantea]
MSEPGPYASIARKFYELRHQRSRLMAATITRAACRLRSAITFSPAIYLRSFTRLFTSWPPPASNPHNRSAADEAACSSAVYRNACKYARPLTVAWSERLHNSVCFIGTVKYPLKRIATRTDQFGVHTILIVKTSPDSHTSFLIHLQMWDEIAQRALQHLKPNDYIYVSGESPVEKYRSHLLMWQVFFANPSEWYDLRKTKKAPKHPDFQHKSTGEALWLRASDPPWVKQQLEVLDSKLSERPMDNPTSRFVFSRWVSD